MSALRKLRREAGYKAGEKYAVELLQPEQPPATRKMSEVLLDFAQPLINTVDDEGFKNAITFAALCWSVSFLSEQEQKQLPSILDELTRTDPLMRAELNA